MDGKVPIGDRLGLQQPWVVHRCGLWRTQIPSRASREISGLRRPLHLFLRAVIVLDNQITKSPKTFRSRPRRNLHRRIIHCHLLIVELVLQTNEHFE